ncbi:Na(+)/H(+) antiporter subunit F1 [Aquibacillus sediminis]|uniref:Na(+)/H(+) antiporter subunit F1 n=1 Tax=Aquibacillus sediminis TaxID=2574734 RepID=UPI001107C820|nr:Na(+)/H(+) antiporter subunit F1 [Aquibacillus sediminis]
MFEAALIVALIIMSVSVFLCFIRVVIGPSVSDRVVALDLIGIHLIGIVGMLMILHESLYYVEVVLVLGILAFIGTIALSKFIEGGVVIDRDHR